MMEGPPQEIDCDVAIVGYGPVGQAMAALLAQSGYRVVVSERHHNRYRLPRAGHLDGETMRTFQSLGIANDVELIARALVSYELVTPEGEVLERIMLAEADAGWKTSYLFHQPELEDVLDRCVQESGATIFMGHIVVGVVQEPDGVRLRVQRTDPDGNAIGGHVDALTVTARYVIGADGARSFLRQNSGIKREDLGFPNVETLVLDLEQANPDRDIPHMGDSRMVLDPRRPYLKGRWSGGRWSRWEFMLLSGETASEFDSEAKAWELLRDRDIDPSVGRLIRRAVYTHESMLAEAWRDRRALLAGDSAHTMPPYLGQGMCSGFRDALNLCWKLDAVLSERAGENLLETYEEERKPHVLELIRKSMQIGEDVVITDPKAAAERDAALRRGEGTPRPSFPTLMSGFLDLDSEGSPKGLAGHLSPQGRVAHGRDRALLDDFIGRGWRLVSRHPIQSDSLAPKHRAILEALDINLAHVTRGAVDDAYIDIDSTYDVWFRESGQKVFLQRPDFVIFGSAATNEDLPNLFDALERQAARFGIGEGSLRPQTAPAR